MLANRVMEHPTYENQEADSLAAGILDLDEWIRSGGYQPARWTGKRAK